MPTKRLVSFLGNRTPEFKGEIQHMNPKLFSGKVPALADYVISDDPEVVRLFEEKGVVDYTKVQSENQPSGSSGASSGRSEEPDSVDAGSGLDGSGVDASTDDSHGNGTISKGSVNDAIQEQEEKEEQVIPDDWESLPFFTQRSIARKFDPSAKTKEDVVRILSSQ